MVTAAMLKAPEAVYSPRASMTTASEISMVIASLAGKVKILILRVAVGDCYLYVYTTEA